MKRPHFLMCPPDYYEVVYEINPWMSVRRKVNQKLAEKQWQSYHKLLTQELKVKVELLKPVQGLPDLVFTANAGLVYKRLFIRSNFRHKERKGEEAHFVKWFKQQGSIVKYVDRPFCFEGQGDMLFLGDDLYAGYHFRSDIEAHDQVASFLKLPYYGLELQDKRFYHLDTCVAPLENQSALVYLPAFEPYAQMLLMENIEDPIQVPEEEALRFACNAVQIGKAVVIPVGCPKTVRALTERGYTPYELDFSEFIKAGGAAKCLVLSM